MREIKELYDIETSGPPDPSYYRLRPARPKPRRKFRGGAPKANSNAVKHGLHTVEMRSLKLRVRRFVAEMHLAVALARAAQHAELRAIVGVGTQLLRK